LNLRPYQQRAIDDLRAAFRQGARAPLLVAPCGAGKTVIFSAIAASAAAKGRSALVLVHRRELIHQASRKLSDTGVTHGVIASGMDPSPGPIQVASVQTLIRRLHTVPEPPDLIIIDEAHHCAAGTWQAIINHWPGVLRIGVTATPCRLDGKGLGDVFDALIKGPSVQMLTSAGHLSSARVFAPPTIADLSKLRRRGGDYALDQAADAMARPTVTGDAIKHYRKLGGDQQAIAFCCNVNHAVSVRDSFETAGIGSELLLGNTSDRDAVVARFASGQTRILVTVDVVSEGFDIPAAGCAILLRPTKSLGLYLQQVGRVLRPAPGKEHAVIIDHVENLHRHGFPDDDREWTLKYGAPKETGQAVPMVRTCPECFAAFKPAPECPVCGHRFEKKSKELKWNEGELKEFTRQVKIVVNFGPHRPHADGYSIVSTCADGHYMIKYGENGLPFKILKDRVMIIKEDPLLLKRFDIKERRSEQGKAQTLPQLIALGQARGMKNPVGWAKHVYFARQRA
jgi:DNA repair protein RadD